MGGQTTQVVKRGGLTTFNGWIEGGRATLIAKGDGSAIPNGWVGGDQTIQMVK
jgi:hypothetical protein